MTTTNTTTTTTAKSTITQTEALRWLIDNAPANTPTDVLDAANRLLVTKSKKYEHSNAPTKTQLENAILAKELVTVIRDLPAGVTPTAKNIAERWNNPSVRSAQKVVAVARIAIENGLITKYVDDKKRTCYMAR